MHTCIGGIMCTRHTDYIHNYMTIRDMLRHAGWFGFWMNCVIKTKTMSGPFRWQTAGSNVLRNRWLGHVAALERLAEGFEAFERFEGGQRAGSNVLN